MTATEFAQLHEEAAVSLLRERLAARALAGFELDDALELAVHVEVDVAAAIGLLARGCPSATAVRILL